MSNQIKNLVTVVELKKTMAAITSTTAETAKTGAGLKNLKEAMAILTVGALDIASGDETYVVTVEGRNDAGAYVVLATFTLSAALGSVAGTYVANIDRCYADLRVNATLGGTSPSLTYTCHLVAPNLWSPAAAQVISA